MNSLRSALTAVLAGLSDAKMQAKGDTEPRRCTSDILTIELVQNTGQVSGTCGRFGNGSGAGGDAATSRSGRHDDNR